MVSHYIAQLIDDKLISCSFDQTIKVWNIFKSSYQCYYTIKSAHKDSIFKVILLSKSRFASCSGDLTIKIWNGSHPYNCIGILEGHEEFVISIIQLKMKEILISVSDDNTLRTWNLNTYQCSTIINNIRCRSTNCLIEIEDGRVIIGGNRKIIVVNINQCKILQVIENNFLSLLYSLMILRDGNVLCGCKYQMCILDVISYTILFDSKKEHNISLSVLLSLNEHEFIGCSTDKTIIVWKY